MLSLLKSQIPTAVKATIAVVTTQNFAPLTILPTIHDQIPLIVWPLIESGVATH